MANAHFYSAGMELPNQGLAPVISASDDKDHKHDFAQTQDGDVVEERVGEAGVVHEQAMPEGPTVTRWEEWAYVSFPDYLA